MKYLKQIPSPMLCVAWILLMIFVLLRDNKENDTTATTKSVEHKLNTLIESHITTLKAIPSDKSEVMQKERALRIETLEQLLVKNESNIVAQ